MFESLNQSVFYLTVVTLVGAVSLIIIVIALGYFYQKKLETVEHRAKASMKALIGQGWFQLNKIAMREAPMGDDINKNLHAVIVSTIQNAVERFDWKDVNQIIDGVFQQIDWKEKIQNPVLMEIISKIVAQTLQEIKVDIERQVGTIRSEIKQALFERIDQFGKENSAHYAESWEKISEIKLQQNKWQEYFENEFLEWLQNLFDNSENSLKAIHQCVIPVKNSKRKKIDNSDV